MYEDSNYSDDWRDSPFYMVLYEYTVKNASLPTDMGTLIAYIFVFAVTWYAVVWTTRLMLSFIWPVILIICSLFVFRYLSTFDHEDLLDMAIEVILKVADTALAVIQKVFEFLLGLLNG